MACMQKMRKESGVCGQIPRQARASSTMAEISAVCSLSTHTIWQPGEEEEEDDKGQKQIVALANKTSCSILQSWRDPGGPGLSPLEQNEWVELTQTSNFSDIWG